MATLAVLAALTAFFIAFGRSGTAPAQRRPLRASSAGDLARDALAGVRTLSQLHDRRRGARCAGGLCERCAGAVRGSGARAARP